MSGGWFRSLALLVLLHLAGWASSNQSSASLSSELLTTVKTLYHGEQWEAVLRLIPASANETPELDYYRGLALARLQRWEEARQAFESGRQKSPADKRFPLELAGVFFQMHNLPDAKAHLAAALKLDSQDAYAHEFLASIHLLEGNLEAAIQHWNRVGRPR